jgi:hypothetical protein
MCLAGIVARTSTDGRLTESVGDAPNPTPIDQNFPHVLAASLHTDLAQKFCWLFLLRV